MPESVDVIVIGGGPAGSTAAALLARAGRRVAVYEKERFPRFHIGESLLPFNVDLFERLGVSSRMEGQYIEKWGARLISSDGSVARYIEFANGMDGDHPMAYQVLRSRFDEMLLRNAQSAGAEVHEGCSVTEATASARDGCEVTVRDASGSTTTRRGRFLLDASGRDAFLASRRRLRRMNDGLRKAAVFAHYEGVPRAEGRCAGDIILIVLRDGWFWMIPLAGGRTSVGLVMDGETWRVNRVNDRMTPEAFLDEAIRSCPAAAARMRAATRVSEVWAASDWSYKCKEIAGDGYLLLGDAAAFIDPIFSTGVYLAMSSGAMAADTLNALFSRGAPLHRASFAGYERKVRRHVGSYLGIVSRFYRPSFMDIFMRPGRRMKIANAVISLLAGMADPPWHVRWRIHFFYAVVALQRRFGSFAPPVPLLGVLERARAPSRS